jgi:type II restriction enzyme
MAFMRSAYRKDYKPNSRETIRRQTLHQFMQAGLVVLNPDDPQRPTNSGSSRYALTPEGLAAASSVGSRSHDAAVAAFVAKHGRLSERETAPRAKQRGIEVSLPDGIKVALSPGAHNTLQRDIVEKFLPRFAPGATVVYMGDTADKDAYTDKIALARLAIAADTHAKLPDVILHRADNQWVYLVESVTSHGPIHTLRKEQLTRLLTGCTASIVFVTAFPDRATFRRYAGEIAWETEVWIADNPDHLIHFNGDKFLGPYTGQ